MAYAWSPGQARAHATTPPQSTAARDRAAARRDREAQGQTAARGSQGCGRSAPRRSTTTAPIQAPATSILAGVGNSRAAPMMGIPRTTARRPGGDAAAALAIVTAARPQAEKKKRDCWYGTTTQARAIPPASAAGQPRPP